MISNPYIPIITKSSNSITVKSNYHPGFYKDTQCLNGVFKDGSWTFHINDDLAVRDACEKHYGYSGLSDPGTMSVLVTCLKELRCNKKTQIYILGRPIGRISKDKSSVLLPAFSVLKKGHPKVEQGECVFPKGTSIEFREVPIPLIKTQKDVARDDYEITPKLASSNELDYLFKVRDSNLQRIKEIDAILEFMQNNPFDDIPSIPLSSIQ